MTKDQIAQWASEAEAHANTLFDWVTQEEEWHAARNDRFAELVAAHERQLWQADAQRWRDVVQQGEGRMHTMFDGQFGFNLPRDKAMADHFADSIPVARRRAKGAA